MAFGRTKDEEAQPGRYVVEHLVIAVSGKGALQRELNRGEALGHRLVQIVPGDGWLLIVWDTRPEVA